MFVAPLAGGTAGNPHDVSDPFNRKCCYTGNVPDSWYCMDMRAYRFRPSHYALKHGYNSPQVWMGSASVTQRGAGGG